MSNSRYALNFSGKMEIRSTVKLLNVSSAKYGGDWHSIPHTHQYAELFYIAGGDGQFQIEDTLYPVRKDQMVIVNPNVMHTEISAKNRPLEYIVLGIEGLALAVSGQSERGHYILDFHNDPDIVSCIRQMMKETQAGLAGYERICQAYTEILLLRLMRTIHFHLTTETQLVSHQCDTVKRYIDTNYKEALSLDDLSRVVHINKYYLAHAFKNEYGISPINYLISRRIEESRYLLRETDMSLSQIARILGFSSASYFSQSFRRAEGISPIEYRKTNRKQQAISTPD